MPPSQIGQQIKTQDYILQIFWPATVENQKGQTLRIFIEGDGRAFVRGYPSQDPSPKSPLVRQLMEQSTGSRVYLARPCQYLKNHHCSVDDWTKGRFSPRVIKAMDEAIDIIKQQVSASDIDLIGYSGGAAIALLLAAQRNDVNHVYTIAGNLDPDWVMDSLSLPRLINSENPVNYKNRLRQIKQTHWLGLDDNIISPAIGAYWQRLMGTNSNIIYVQATHSQGWLKLWQHGPWYTDIMKPDTLMRDN